MKSTKRFILGMMSILLVCNSSLPVTWADIKSLGDRINVIKRSYREYKNAERAYNDCIHRHCAQEIETLKKISEEFSKTTKDDRELRKILANDRIVAQEKFDACISKHCKEAKEKLRGARQKLILVAGGMIATITAISISAFAIKIKRNIKINKENAELMEQLEKQQQQTESENREQFNEELMDRHRIKDDAQARKILNYRRNDQFDRRDITRLTLPLLRAMAEIYYHKKNISDDELAFYINDFQVLNSIPAKSMKKILEKKDEMAEEILQ
jgi:hypothetical protein